MISAQLISTFSEVDNDAYCVCTHDFLLCTHRKLRPVRTMYAVNISGTQTIFDFMRTRKNTFKIVTKQLYNLFCLTALSTMEK